MRQASLLRSQGLERAVWVMTAARTLQALGVALWSGYLPKVLQELGARGLIIGALAFLYGREVGRRQGRERAGRRDRLGPRVNNDEPDLEDSDLEDDDSDSEDEDSYDEDNAGEEGEEVEVLDGLGAENSVEEQESLREWAARIRAEVAEIEERRRNEAEVV